MSKKIIFMGTPLFAVPILKSLYQNGYPISVVFTQPEKKSQRGMGVNRTPVQNLSETLNIECRTPLSLKNNKEEYDYFKNLNADLAIVVAYGKLIPKEILDLTKKGFISSLEGMFRNTNYKTKKTNEYKDEGTVNEIHGVLSYKSIFITPSYGIPGVP